MKVMKRVGRGTFGKYIEIFVNKNFPHDTRLTAVEVHRSLRSVLTRNPLLCTAAHHLRARVKEIIPHVYVSRPSHPLMRAMNFFPPFSFSKAPPHARRSDIFRITLKMKVRSSKADPAADKSPRRVELVGRREPAEKERVARRRPPLLFLSRVRSA